MPEKVLELCGRRIRGGGEKPTRQRPSWAAFRVGSRRSANPQRCGRENHRSQRRHCALFDRQTETTGQGAILLNATNGGGHFLTKTNVQGITLTP
jgi:hypothetical protein